MDSTAPILAALGKIKCLAELIVETCEQQGKGGDGISVIQCFAREIVEKCQVQKPESEPDKDVLVLQVTCDDPLPVQDKRQKQNMDDLAEKPLQLEQREIAGNHVIPFGKHKGKRINQVPVDYVRWMLGFKQRGRKFESIPTLSSSASWSKTTNLETLSNANKYMVWRCWACGNGETRFKNAKLCTACWHELE